ncbi:hypothetical protein [Streptomyces endophyticus]|uniref:Uncharacterized protein n=1 Tax=Streptomyces endophyticus TaxID=714166 RepID=A0ABU6F9D4_9ACTN|nr:hypothetical protein [Streptomyces endophyticus]MEB8340640.1 hypothetical protein [Streptomyces endophyticus]
MIDGDRHRASAAGTASSLVAAQQRIHGGERQHDLAVLVEDLDLGVDEAPVGLGA